MYIDGYVEVKWHIGIWKHSEGTSSIQTDLYRKLTTNPIGLKWNARLSKEAMISRDQASQYEMLTGYVIILQSLFVTIASDM